jgi:hypothetical protein
MAAPSIFITVHAGPGKITDLGFGKFLAVGDLVNLHPGDTAFLVRFVTPDGDVVFGRARGHARPAPGALIQIYDHPVFEVFSLAMFFFHDLPHKLVRFGHNWNAGMLEYLVLGKCDFFRAAQPRFIKLHSNFIT